jgi:RND superfamily putative drug exporter
LASIFTKLGRSVTRHHRTVIVIWVIIFLALIWFAPLANQAVVYDDNSSSGRESLESTTAKQWIEDRFGLVTDQGSVMIVLSAPTVTDGSSRDAVLALERVIAGNRFAGSDGSNITVHVVSIYSLAETYSVTFMSQIGDSYQLAYGLANVSRYAVFDIPLSFWTMYNDTADMQKMEFGIPSMYLANWNAANTSHPTASMAWKDGTAYNASRASVMDWLVNSTTMDLTERSVALSYLGSFASAWNGTASDPNLTSVPLLRAQVSLDNGFAGLVQTEAFLSLPPQERSLSFAVKGNFTLDNFGEMPRTDNFVEGLFETELEQRTSSLSQSQKDVARSYFALFYTGWSSFDSAPDLQQFRSLVTSAVNVTAKQLPAELGQMMVSLYQTLGWEGWRNDSLLTSFTTNTIAARTGSQPWVVQDAVSFGPNASGQITSLAHSIVTNSTLDHFPILLVPALVSEFVNVPTNDTMLLSLSFTSETGTSVSGKPFVPAIRQIVSDRTTGTEITAYVTGPDAISSDIRTSMDQDLARIDPVTILLVIILIGLFFRSLVSSSIPPMVIGMALGISFSAIYFIGTYVLSVNYTVLTLLITSMLGAGCDYCIFILSRYREERGKGNGKVRSIETSVTWAGEAIATSGATVIIGFGMLSFGRLDVLRSMGTLAIGISLALLMALTLLPAIMMLLGDAIFWPSKVRRAKHKRANGYFTRSARFSIRHAKAIVVTALLISVPATYVVLTLNTSYDYIGSMPDSQSKQGLNVLADGFGGGKVIPTYVGVGLTGSIFNSTGGYDAAKMNAVENISRALAAMPHVASVVGPTRPYGETIDYRHVSGNGSVQAALYDQFMRTMVGTDNRSVLLTVTFVDEPFARSSVASIDSIRNVGDVAVGQCDEITTVVVGGGTASMYDASVMTQQDFMGISLLVIAGIYLVLMFVLGSILVPARSIVTIMISISWTLALTLLLFQYVIGTSVVWIVPMVLLVVCLGLGLDYDILLVTRVREEIVNGRSDEEAIVHAVDQTGGIITACGIIMASAFGTMMISQSMMLREFGFALSLAIMMDAFFVRIYLFPAMMSLMGKWNWYAPKGLKRMHDKMTAEPKPLEITAEEPVNVNNEGKN